MIIEQTGQSQRPKGDDEWPRDDRTPIDGWVRASGGLGVQVSRWPTVSYAAQVGGDFGARRCGGYFKQSRPGLPGFFFRNPFFPSTIFTTILTSFSSSRKSGPPSSRACSIS